MAKIGDSIHNPVTGERITFLKTAANTEGDLLQFELTVPPGGFPVGGAPHIHPQQEERFLVLSGSLWLWIDGEERTLRAGDELTGPAGIPHYWENAGPEEASVLVELRPALRTEALFETFFGLARAGKTDTSGRPNIFQMAVILDEFREEAGGVTAADRLLFMLIPLLAIFGRRMGYKAIYPEYAATEDYMGRKV